MHIGLKSLSELNKIDCIYVDSFHIYGQLDGAIKLVQLLYPISEPRLHLRLHQFPYLWPTRWRHQTGSNPQLFIVDCSKAVVLWWFFVACFFVLEFR